MDDNKIYYIENTPWKEKLNLSELKHFDEIKYDDIIILHYDFSYSYLKIMSKQKANNLLFISAINCCLRFNETIRKIYPYNKVYVIIHMNDQLAKTLQINSRTFQTVIDMIPNFAVVNQDSYNDILKYYNTDDYKHIVYGKCNKIKDDLLAKNLQQWSLFKGKIIIR